MSAYLPHLVNFVEWRGAGRKAEHNRPPSLGERRAQHADFFSFIWTAGDAVRFHEVNAPTGVKLRDGIVISLRGGFGRVESPVIRIPRAGVGGVGGIGGVKRRISNRKIRLHRLARNPAHNVQPKFEAEGMNVVGERLKSGPVGGGREAVDVGSVAAKFIHAELRSFRIAAGGGIDGEPFHVHDHILPAVRLQVFSDPFGVGADVGFGDGGAVGVPTVPSHGRRRGENGTLAGLGGKNLGDNHRAKNRQSSADQASFHPDSFVTALMIPVRQP